MKYLLGACFRWLLKATSAASYRDARNHVCFILLCSGLAAAAVLAPVRLARMRSQSPVKDHTAPPEDTTSIPLRAPEEAACAMLQDRFRALIDGQVESLKKNYDTGSDTGLWSWEREAARCEYVRMWAKDRNLKIIETKARIDVDGVSYDSADRVWVEITEHAQYTYAPDCEGDAGGDGEVPWTHTFGSRAVHVMELVLRGGDWKIRRDWYGDPLGDESCLPPCKFVVEEDLELPDDLGYVSMPDPAEEGPRGGGQYDRRAALEYAVRYAGVPSMEGSGKYNPQYRVYTFVGGDCASFASQVLQAGGLRQGYGWHYTSEGSAAWVRGEDLIWHLLSAGRAEKIYAGDFGGAVKGTPRYPRGAVSALEPGDLIGYETKGQICHVAVVVGKDPSGYVTIASHTADRLFFPWDMGWNDNTVFWLIKITY